MGTTLLIDLLAILLLKAELNLLARDQPVELARVCRPYLETSLLHDDPVLRSIHDSDLADHLRRRQYEALPLAHTGT